MERGYLVNKTVEKIYLVNETVVNGQSSRAFVLPRLRENSERFQETSRREWARRLDCIETFPSKSARQGWPKLSGLFWGSHPVILVAALRR